MDAQTIAWSGGEHPFALRLGELRRLQTNCDAGPEEIFTRIRSGTWRDSDLMEPIRLGLIGGGMEEREAGPLVTRLFEQHPLVDFKFTAHHVLHNALLGPMDDMPEKSEGETAPPAESGGSATSTPQEQ